jgi:glyoxylase-like metal-dependent hydrolase (beta-lactamase superfamily II)
MEIITETVGPFAENSYFLVERGSLEAVAIDPGDEAGRLLEIIDARGFKLRWILNTHAHLDHVGAVQALKEATGAPFYLHRADRFLLDLLPAQAAAFGLRPPPVPAVDGWLEEGDVFEFGAGRIRIEVIETPGHSPGGVTFVAEGALFSGDALFQGSIGRTDLPGGDYETLIRSIRERLLVFPDETPVYSGHGPPTTVGEERRGNPFLA